MVVKSKCYYYHVLNLHMVRLCRCLIKCLASFVVAFCFYIFLVTQHRNQLEAKNLASSFDAARDEKTVTPAAIGALPPAKEWRDNVNDKVLEEHRHASDVSTTSMPFNEYRDRAISIGSERASQEQQVDSKRGSDQVASQPALRVDLIEDDDDRRDAHSSDMSTNQFSNISNNAASEMDASEQLATPRDRNNLTLASTGLGLGGADRQEQNGAEDDVCGTEEGGAAGAISEMKDASADGFKTGGSHDSNENGQLLLDLGLVSPIKSIGEEIVTKKSLEKSKIPNQHEGMDFQDYHGEVPHAVEEKRSLVVQYSDKQTERIRAKEAQVRARQRQQRKRARLGLQAQDAQQNSPSKASSLRKDEPEHSLNTPAPSLHQQQVVEEHSWRRGKTRRKPEYDGVPDSSPGGSRHVMVQLSQATSGGGGARRVSMFHEEEDEVDEYPKMDWTTIDGDDDDKF